MDRQNLSDLKRMRRPSSKAKVMLFGEYSGKEGKAEIIDDPYYGGQNGFEVAYEQAMRFGKNFLKEVGGGARVGEGDGNGAGEA